MTKKIVRQTPDELRAIKKTLVLDGLASSNTIQSSCQGAGISRSIYYEWVNSGYISQEEIQGAYAHYLDNIRHELLKRAIEGTSKQLFQNGKLVRDEHGNPVIQTLPDNKILLAIAMKLLPELREQSELQEQASAAIDLENGLYFSPDDIEKAWMDEWNILKEIAHNLSKRTLPLPYEEIDGKRRIPFKNPHEGESYEEKQERFYENYHPPTTIVDSKKPKDDRPITVPYLGSGTDEYDENRENTG